MQKKKVIIVGAGPAGLSAAYELLSRSDSCSVEILEESDHIGGIARTARYHGNRMDMGGHRFFSKSSRVNAWWKSILPPQSAPALDELLSGKGADYSATVQEGEGADPESQDEVMLTRKRISRILFDRKFYDYPISLKAETLLNLGPVKTLQVCFSYLGSALHKLPEDNLENFYINRFGKKLYSLFFEYYTENLWGRHPRDIDASWGAQRVKGLSIPAVLKDVFGRLVKRKNRKVETSLIEAFQYPKYGPGQLWELTAEKIASLGGMIRKNTRVLSFGRDENGSLTEAHCLCDGKELRLTGDIFISSMPIRDLTAGLPGLPPALAAIGAGLPYRDYMTLGVLVRKLKLQNKTKIRTVGNIIPDCWIYVQDRSVKMGRIQIYNNWSPYLVKDFEHTVWLGLEYFTNEGESLWEMADGTFTEMAISEMLLLDLIDSREDVLDTHVERVKKAYPAYFDTYSEIDPLIDYLNSIDNLYCVGRNGQHRYNNMDHSMLTSFLAVDHILTGKPDKAGIWKVNTELEYHEGK